MTYGALIESAHAIKELTGADQHDVVLVLGSGLGALPDNLKDAVSVPYAEIPKFPVPTVVGHSGTLYSAQVGDVRTLVLSGRAHAYEGHPLDRVVHAVRAAILTGCKTLVVTNAAGGCADGLEPGDLVLIRDHLNLTGRNPLEGPNDDRLGPRFPDMTAAYDPDLRAVAAAVAMEEGIELEQGVYAWLLGPTYETPSEVQMARRLGADLVGMSTVPEVIAARHMGARVLGMSLVTNLAAGISDTPLTHDDVQIAAEAASDRFVGFMLSLIPRL